LGDAPVDVEFVIDTGADITVLQLRVLVDAGADEQSLPGLPLERNYGAGGAVIHAMVGGRLSFTHEDGTEQVYVGTLRSLLEASPGPGALSILGMDVLREFRVVVSVQEGRVELQDPAS
jgi:hypothetical protein